MLFCLSIITSSILLVTYQFYWGQKSKKKIIFKTAKGLRAFFTDRLVRKQVWGKLRKIYCCGICLRKPYFSNLLWNHQINRHFEMQLEFFLVDIVVSIFWCNKILLVLSKFTMTCLMGAVVVAQTCKRNKKKASV